MDSLDSIPGEGRQSFMSASACGTSSSFVTKLRETAKRTLETKLGMHVDDWAMGQVCTPTQQLTRVSALLLPR